MYTIRQASYEDATAIANIHVRTWKNTYQDLIDEKDISNMTYENRKVLWQTILQTQTEDRVTLVIHQNEQIIGFISGGPERTKRFNYDAEIYTIYILDEHQKKGLGAQLLAAFSKKMLAFGHQSLLVWILKQNPSSRFYERYEAKPVGYEETTIGEGTYRETAYGWTDLEGLVKKLKYSNV
ncbi:GNAT family N-acetyltransferase [Virgibacillus soli]|uniref:GNAT family N-acetyltransferase n=1 Tax=Paracerasibacillus soli TaxID=480284 RepID=UPI0035E6564D